MEQAADPQPKHQPRRGLRRGVAVVLSAQEQAELVQMYPTHTQAQLVEHFGLARSTITRLLREAGVEMRPRGHVAALQGYVLDPYKERIHVLYAQGYCVKEIARQLDLSVDTLYHFCEREGLEPHRKKRGDKRGPPLKKGDRRAARGPRPCKEM